MAGRGRIGGGGPAGALGATRAGRARRPVRAAGAVAVQKPEAGVRGAAGLPLIHLAVLGSRA